MPKDVYNTGSNSEHGNWLNKCVTNFNWPIINIFVFQNSTIEILDKNQDGRGVFLLVLKEDCWSRILKASYIFISNYYFSHVFIFVKVQFSYRKVHHF